MLIRDFFCFFNCYCVVYVSVGVLGSLQSLDASAAVAASVSGPVREFFSDVRRCRRRRRCRCSVIVGQRSTSYTNRLGLIVRWLFVRTEGKPTG